MGLAGRASGAAAIEWVQDLPAFDGVAAQPAIGLGQQPKSWWSNGRPLWAIPAQPEAVVVVRSAGRPLRSVAAQAEVGVVGRTAAVVNRGTGQSRGGRVDGHDGRSRHRPRSWWLSGWSGWAAVATAEAVVGKRLSNRSDPPHRLEEPAWVSVQGLSELGNLMGGWMGQRLSALACALKGEWGGELAGAGWGC